MHEVRRGLGSAEAAAAAVGDAHGGWEACTHARVRFFHVARTSLEQSRRAAERPPRVKTAVVVTAGKVPVGSVPSLARAPCSVAPAHAHRHTGARQKRADGSGGR